MSNYVFHHFNFIKNFRTFTFLLFGATLILSANIPARAATFTVTNTNDSGAGSLRQAILDANVNNENDAINFDPAVFSAPQTIVLTTGELVISPDNTGGGEDKSVTINGTGANLLTISGNNHSRIFRAGGILIIDGVKITGGNGTQNGETQGTLQGIAGAIYLYGRPTDEERLILKNSIVSENQSSAYGGGLYLHGNTTIINSTISNNKTEFFGGGISGTTRLRVINSTISHNTAKHGAGVYGPDSIFYLINSTIAFNRVTGGATSGVGVQITGGALYPRGALYFRNSIIAKNTAADGVAADLSASFLMSEGFNIVGSTFGIGAIYGDTTGNQLDVDPQLDRVLRNNGGTVPTHALHVNSPAVDKGDNCVLNTTANGGCLDSNITSDQRGVSRHQDGNQDGTATVDIGAFEITGSEVSNSSSAPNLQAVSDTGASNSDNLTMSRNLSFDVSGTITGITYEIFRDGELIASKTSNSGTITFTDNNLPADGVFVYSVRPVYGNTPTLQSSVVIRIDNTGPNVGVYRDDTQPILTKIQPVNFKAEFNENIVGFDKTDISLADSTSDVSMANIELTGSGKFYKFKVSNVTSGKLIPKIPANAVQDLAGNWNTPSIELNTTVTIDTIPPTVTINQEASQAEPTRNTPINFTVVFSEPVTGFTNADVSLAGSTANVGNANISVTGSGTTYNVAVSNFSSNGATVQASVKNQAASDALGNLSLASTSTDNIVTVDNTGPTVTINQASGQPDPTNSLPVNFTVVFNEPVTGFDADDVSLINSSFYPPAATVTVTGSGTTYNVAVDNISSNGGYLRPSVRSSAVSDALGNPSSSSNSTDNMVLVDNVAPTVTINQAIGQSDPARLQPVKFTVVFNESVTGFTADDVSLAESTADVSSASITVTRNGNVYTVSISNITSSGQVKASLLAGAVQDQRGNASLASTNTDNTITVNVNRSLMDFDGDGKSDISVFRPDNATWYLQQSNSGFAATQFGISTDELVPADYDGDGKTDIAVFRDGIWYLLQSANGFRAASFGQAEDVPQPADFDGDGRSELVVYRPSAGSWYVLNLVNNQFSAQQFGVSSDKPVVGDYDGDGRADYAVYRAENGTWYLLQSTAGFAGIQFGISTDKPVAADYDGDGKRDIGVFREGNWYLLQSTKGFAGFQFGIATDFPSPADYDGDGKADAAVFREGNWYLLGSTSGFSATQFGQASDKPVPNAFIR